MIDEKLLNEMELEIKKIHKKLDNIVTKLDRIGEKTECISNNLKNFDSKEQLKSINEIKAKVEHINKI